MMSGAVTEVCTLCSCRVFAENPQGRIERHVLAQLVSMPGRMPQGTAEI